MAAWTKKKNKGRERRSERETDENEKDLSMRKAYIAGVKRELSQTVCKPGPLETAPIFYAPKFLFMSPSFSLFVSRCSPLSKSIPSCLPTSFERYVSEEWRPAFKILFNNLRFCASRSKNKEWSRKTSLGSNGYCHKTSEKSYKKYIKKTQSASVDE